MTPTLALARLAALWRAGLLHPAVSHGDDVAALLTKWKDE